ncbi:hypothetical protein QCA50_014577 [Cerrena zonata]|uniref:Uncharacterized protein n=1 Tax=Cerrena zonata TaxID=2478898 RepID=A0AAW0FQK7_9APHY
MSYSHHHHKSLSVSTQETAVDDEPHMHSRMERCSSPTNSSSASSSSPSGSLEMDTYRRLLAGMAETCRSLQARIRILETDLALRSEQNRRLLNNSPLSSPNAASFQLPPSPNSANFTRRERQKRDHRRHSAPQLTLGTVLEVSEDFSDEPDSGGTGEKVGCVNRSEVWVFHDDRAFLEKVWMWY